MEQVIFGGASAHALSNADTIYNSLVGGYVWTTDEFNGESIVSTSGKIKNLRVKLTAAPSAGKSYAFTLMLNGSPTALTLAISDTATSGSDTTEIDVVAGDTISLRCIPSGTPDIVWATWTSMFAGTTANESLILGGTGNNLLHTVDIEYAQVIGASSNTTTTEDNTRQVCPTAGTIKNLYVELSADPGTSPSAYRFTLRLNGATVAQSSIVTITADDTIGNDTSKSLVVAAGDIITMMIEPLNAPSVSPKAQWGMTFVADTDGESIILSGTDDNLDATGSEYMPLQGHDVDTWNFSEAARYQLGQVCTLKKLYVLLSAAPAAGKSRTFTVRIGIANSNVVVTISDTATTGNSSALEDTIVDDEYVTLRAQGAGTPDAADAYWGLVGYIVPAVTGIQDKSANMAVKMMARGLI